MPFFWSSDLSLAWKCTPSGHCKPSTLSTWSFSQFFARSTNCSARRNLSCYAPSTSCFVWWWAERCILCLFCAYWSRASREGPASTCSPHCTSATRWVQSYFWCREHLSRVFFGMREPHRSTLIGWGSCRTSGICWRIDHRDRLSRRVGGFCWLFGRAGSTFINKNSYFL